MFKTARHLAIKDLRLFFRDKTALMLSLVLPIVLATVFGTAMKGMTGSGSSGGVKDLPLAVEDLDQSPGSAALMERLEELDGVVIRKEADSRALVRNGDVAMALVIDTGYGAQLEAGEIPKLKLLQDPSQSITVQVLTGRMLPALIGQTIDTARAPLFRKFLGQAGFPSGGLDQAVTIFDDMVVQMDRVANAAVGAAEPGESAESTEGDEGATADEQASEGGGMNFFEDIPRMLGVEVEDVMKASNGPSRSAGVSHAFAAMAVMMLMFSLVAGAGTLLEEKEQGTLSRLLLIPNAADAILLGKGLFLAGVGALQLLVLFTFGWLAFQVPIWDHFLEIAVISGATVFSVVGMGLLFAVWSRTRKQLEGSSTLVILAMSAVGGAWFPREFTPDVFQAAGRFTLTAWSMDAYHGAMWYGKKLWPTEELNGVWVEVVVLLAIGAALMAFSRVIYRRRFRNRVV